MFQRRRREGGVSCLQIITLLPRSVFRMSSRADQGPELGGIPRGNTQIPSLLHPCLDYNILLHSPTIIAIHDNALHYGDT